MEFGEAALDGLADASPIAFGVAVVLFIVGLAWKFTAGTGKGADRSR